MSRDKSEYTYGLDIFRSAAILMVLIGHSFEHSSLPKWVADFGRLGSLGVELFFVLSGFLIGSIIVRLIDQGRLRTFADIRDFWTRRWLRTLPLYVVIYLAFLRFDYHGRHGLLDYPQYLIFFQNFAWKIPEFFELSWSLAVEEHFYFWFPLVYLACSRVLKNSLVAVVAAAGIFICIVYIYRSGFPLFSDWNEYQRTIRLSVLSRADAIMFGVLMAVAKRYFPPAFKVISILTPFWALAFVLMCCWYYIGVPGLMTSKFLQVNIYTLQSIFCALLLPWFDGMKKKPDTGYSEFFVVTSRLAYSLYLVHILVIIAVNRLLGWSGMFDLVYPNPVAIYAIYFSLYYLTAWITYLTIERPFLRLRDGIFSWRESVKSAWPALSAISVLIGIA